MAENPLPPYVHTDWHRYDFREIWHQIQPEDDFFTRLQERAWNRTYDLLDAHRAKLESLFDGLAEVWPPIAGSASETYLSQLRTLIASVTTTSHDASGNALAVASIGDTLMNARANVQRLQDQTAQPYDAGNLNNQAASIMADSDKATYDYASLLRVSEPYGTGAIVGPPTRGQHQGHTDGVLGGGSAAEPSKANSSASRPPGPADNGGPEVVPVLSGGSGSSVSSPPVGATTPGTSSASAGHDPALGVWPASIIGSPSSQLRGAASPNRSTGSAFRPDGTVDREQRTSGSTRTDQMSRGSAATEPGASEHGVLGPAGLGAGGTSRPRRRRASGPAYTEWAVASGVPAVLNPPPEPTTFDPGPGVFGIDR